MVSNENHEVSLNEFVDVIVQLTLRERMIEKINLFIVNTNEKKQIAEGELLDLTEALQTEQDKTPFHNEQIVVALQGTIIPNKANILLGFNTLIQQLLDLQNNIILPEISDLQDDKAALITLMTVFELTTIEIDSNEPWPQGEQTIIVNKQQLTGSVTGKTFTLSGVVEALDVQPVNMDLRLNSNPNEFWIQNWPGGETPILRNRYCLTLGQDFSGTTQYRVIFVTQQEGNHCYFSPIVYEDRDTIDGRQTYGFKLYGPGDTINAQSPAFLSEDWVPLLSPQPVSAPDWVTGMYQQMVGDWSLELGDSISFSSGFDEIHIANLYESDAVLEVMAYREWEGKTILMPLPTHYYTIDLAYAVAGFTTTAILLQRPLREYEGENWEDQIYVTLESTLLANTASQIHWLITNWTDFTFDTTTFISVISDLANFPSNFALLDKRDALDLIEDMAWQARCAVWLVNDEMFIKYLSKEPDIDGVINESDIEATTLQTSFTETEAIITIVEGEWVKDYSAKEKNKIILRNNVPIYGVHQEKYDMFIYTDEELIQRSLTFWLIRYSNTWRKIIFQGFMKLIKFEVFDTLLVNLSVIDLPPVKCVVEDLEYNNEDNSIKVTLWVPIRAGFTAVYPFAWMSSAPPGLEYPTVDDPHAGGG